MAACCCRATRRAGVFAACILICSLSPPARRHHGRLLLPRHVPCQHLGGAHLDPLPVQHAVRGALLLILLGLALALSIGIHWGLAAQDPAQQKGMVLIVIGSTAEARSSLPLSLSSAPPPSSLSTLTLGDDGTIHSKQWGDRGSPFKPRALFGYTVLTLTDLKLPWICQTVDAQSSACCSRSARLSHAPAVP